MSDGMPAAPGADAVLPEDIPAEDTVDRGIPIRAITRGLAVLQELNRNRPMTMMEVARKTHLPYPTTCRIMQTLVHEGWVEREETHKRYRPTELVRSLAAGFTVRDKLVEASRPHLFEMGDSIKWPVSLCTKVGLNVMVKCTTHPFSPIAFNHYEPGYTLPILESSAGKVLLAFAEPDEVASTIKAVESSVAPFDESTLMKAKSGALFTEIRDKGFCSQIRNPHTNTLGAISSIAVPILKKDQPIASLSMMFFSRAMSVTEATSTYLRPLQKTARNIADAFSQDRT